MKKLLKIFLLFICILVIFIPVVSIVNAAEDNRMVFTTESGSKYHSIGCDYLTARPHKTTILNAESAGYSPCKVCNPYGRATEFYGTTENEYDFDFSEILLDFLITILFYMGLPLLLLLIDVRFQTKKGLIIFCVFNSILIKIFFISISEVNNTNSMTPYFYGLINYKLLKKYILQEEKFSPKNSTELNIK